MIRERRKLVLFSTLCVLISSSGTSARPSINELEFQSRSLTEPKIPVFKTAAISAEPSTKPNVQTGFGASPQPRMVRLKIRACGEVLIQVLYHACHLETTWPSVDGVTRTLAGGLEEECCKHTCTYSTLRSYC